MVLPVRLERQTAVGCRREIPAGFERGRRSPGAPRAPPPVVRPRGSRVRVALHARGVGQGRRRRREGETLRERIERERQLPVGGCPGCSVRKAQGLNAFCRTGRASPAYPRCPGGLPRRSRRRRARCRWRRLFWTAAAGSSAIRGVVTAIGCVRRRRASRRRRRVPGAASATAGGSTTADRGRSSSATCVTTDCCPSPGLPSGA